MKTIVSVVAAVLSFKEGLEMSEEKAGNWSAKMKTEPKWTKRLDNKVLRMRRDVNIMEAWLGKKVKNTKTKGYVRELLRRKQLSGSKASIETKCKISVAAKKIQRYLRQSREKEQNQQFSKERKAFY